MKRILLITTCGCLLVFQQAFAQSSSAVNTYLGGRYLGWDASSGPNPLLFKTKALNRMKLNGDVSYSVASDVAARNGYLLLGSDMPMYNMGPTELYSNFGAFSLLHLSGSEGNYAQYFGHRSWMKTGITFTDNNDMSYFGLRRVGTGFDITETALVWADNSGSTAGPDDFVLRFNSGDNSTTFDNDLTNSNDIDGLHVGRFTGTGHFALGNTFGVNAAGTPAGLYVRPQSLLHMSYQHRYSASTPQLNEDFGFMQITYRRENGAGADLIGQGELASDGLRFGIDNQTFNFGTTNFLNSYLRWQEASSFIIQTEDGGTPNIEQNERMRFTSIGALVANHGTAYGGLTTPTNISRVAISHNGLIPITKPLSLLHLGYQTFGGGNDGWRQWMDVGVYTSNGTDQVFLGLKPENGSGTLGDRQDAVLNWGDNMTGAGSADNFRMIFTSAPSGTAPATGANGLEGMRMTPTAATGIFTGIGGDPTAPNLYYGGSINPTSTLEVNSWDITGAAGGSSGLRFTNLTTASPTVVNPGKGLLAVDSTGKVIYVPALNGLACWDLNGNNIGDPNEDINNDGFWNTLDCQGAQGACWDLNGDGVQDQNEDVNNDGQWNALDCQGGVGVACWDLNGNGLTDPNEDINGDALWNALDCQGDNGLQCWDLNGNGFFDAPTEDMNGNNIPDIGDCRGTVGPQGPIGPQGPVGITPGAHNGTSMSTIDPVKVAFGQDYTQPGDPGRLLNTRQIPMNDYNILFTNTQTTSNSAMNRIGIGTYTPTAKVDITMDPAIPSASPTGLNILNTQVASSGNALGARISVTGNNSTNGGMAIRVTPGNSLTSGIGISIVGSSPNSNGHTAINANVSVTGLPSQAHGISASAEGARANWGGIYSAQGVAGSYQNRAIHAQAGGTGTSENISVYAQTIGTGSTNYGIRTSVTAGTGIAYGIHSYAPTTTNPANRAGYFVGPVQVTGAPLIGSDQQFKTNVNRLEGSLKLIQATRPVTYYMDSINYAQFNFDTKKQFGFIAQQLETVFPNLVYESVHPAEHDSLGNEIIPAVPYKSVNYIAMIPVNTAAIIELNNKVDQISLSDQSIKTNVQNLTGSLQKVLDMRGVSYDWVHNIHPELNLDSANHIGFVAQELQQVDPRLTFVADDSLLHVEYEKVVPILAEAIKELNGKVTSKDSIINAQQGKIDDLNNRLSQLENCLSGILPYLCQLSQSAVKANTPAAQEEVRKNLNVTLSDHNTIILDQNVPNPFAEQTMINFSIPATVRKAQIYFYDGNGKLLHAVEVKERGPGSLTVFGSDLSSGVYTYTLVADGQVVATKKMIKQ